MEDKIKHLEFVQAIINRMGSNPFQIKGWCISFVAALLALYAGTDNNNIKFIFVAIAPAILFVLLDAYYLQQERIFSSIYDAIIQKRLLYS